VGLILAEPVRADRDYPPFRRAMMDGYAVVVADAGRTIDVVGEVAAGQAPALTVAPGACASIMTGAPCPEGAEAVVKREDVTLSGRRVALPARVAAGQHIAARGSECEAGALTLEAGMSITPLVVAVLTTVGRREVRAFAPPRLAVISTGDELVEAGRQPGEAQIRNSNGPMLAALSRLAGLPEPDQLHALDTLESLEGTLQRASRADIILLSGGVSAGRFDLVPQALRRYGAEPVFHKVTQKPGKPLLFATRGRQLIFGLPGNPLSSHFCFSRYVRPAARKMMGQPPLSAVYSGRLSEPLRVKSARTLFVLARATEAGGGAWSLRPLLGQGSADIFASAGANAYIRLPVGDHDLPAGATQEFLWIGGSQWPSSLT
jgi:molybdopterin molybdotransferase